LIDVKRQERYPPNTGYQASRGKKLHEWSFYQYALSPLLQTGTAAESGEIEADDSQICRITSGGKSTADCRDKKTGSDMV
jgi:hypothetical protein